MVHEEQTKLDEPDGDALHLLGDEDHLGAELALADLGGRQDDVVVRADEVAVSVGDDVHADHEDGVGAHGDEHEPVVELEFL